MTTAAKAKGAQPASAGEAEDLKKEVFFDGVEFDAADPEKYAKSFAVNSLA